MSSQTLNDAIALILGERPTLREKGVQQIYGMCCFEDRALSIAKEEGVLDMVYELVFSSDPVDHKNGAQILSALHEYGAREALKQHPGFEEMIGRMETSFDNYIREIAEELKTSPPDRDSGKRSDPSALPFGGTDLKKHELI